MEKSHDHSPDSRDGVQRVEKARQERLQDRPSGFLGTISKLGDLPEWKIKGNKLSGKGLNTAIAWVASCGFLMFGYGTLRSTSHGDSVLIVRQIKVYCPLS